MSAAQSCYTAEFTLSKQPRRKVRSGGAIVTKSNGACRAGTALIPILIIVGDRLQLIEELSIAIHELQIVHHSGI